MATKKSSKQSEQSASKQDSAAIDENKQKAAASKGGSTNRKDDDTIALDTEDDQAEDAGQELDQLLEMLEESELTELDPEEAIEIIEEWHDILNESGDASLKAIGKSLNQLKKALSASKSKPGDIAEALTNLGEQTDEYANNAQRGYKTKLHQLGKALTRAGESLEETEEA
jgi:ABC-type transporter Mla subunit MlaD